MPYTLTPEQIARGDVLRDALQRAKDDLLRDMTSVQDIGRRLRDAGCFGFTRDCYECPIAIWFRGRLTLEPGERVSAGTGAVVVNTPVVSLAHIRLGRLLADFIEIFDDGMFAGLEA